MRRIYESDALRRDDDEAFAPNERETSHRLQAMRSIDSTALSDRLVPIGLGRRAIAVEVSTPRSEYAVGEAVPFSVAMKNPLPFPITIPTTSPVLWTWNVDGEREASRVSVHEPPDEPGEFRFDRGERKEFRKRWRQMFRVSDAEWEPAGPGEYAIGAGINVEDAADAGLYDETTVRVVSE